MKKNSPHNAGFSLVEAIIVSAVTVVIFGALFSSFQYSLRLVAYSKAKLSAMSLATQRMEYFRSLPYNDVGTVLGIPPGVIPQNSVSTLNGIDFNEKVLVDYVDDDADGKDGTGTPDSNGIPADYKRVTLEYTWTIGSVTNEISLVSNIVPRSIETTAGGGTVRINVIDENSNLLQGASVRLINSVIGTPVDVTKNTDSTGAALFSGAPAGSDYEVIVNGNIGGKEYSTAQTYQVSGANPTPVVAPFSVVEADVSTLTFQIGALSDLDIKTLSVINEGMFRETFTDLTAVDTSTDVVASSGELKLADVAGVYKNAGSVYLGPITSTPLQEWQTVQVAADEPVNTSHFVRFYTGVTGGPYVLIPDGDLAGNAAGFTSSRIDIAGLDSAVYPTIFVGVDLATSDTGRSPTVDELTVFYRQSETALANVGFNMLGSKIIGTDGGGVPIPKYDNTHTTDGSGELSLVDLEFDSYTATPTGSYDIASACPANPFVQQAGIDGRLELELVANAASTLRVTVTDVSGQVIPGASVNLKRSGYDVTVLTNSCGQAFFTGGVTDNVDYVVTVTNAGFVTNASTAVSVSGDTFIPVTLSQ